MSSTPSASPDQPARQPAPTPPRPHHSPGPASRAKTKDPAINFTRAGALWSALIAGFLILILLLVFITQNIDIGDVPSSWAGIGACR